MDKIAGAPRLLPRLLEKAGGYSPVLATSTLLTHWPAECAPSTSPAFQVSADLSQ